MSEEKIKIKAERLLFFLVGHNFYMSEDSLTVKYSESGLTYIHHIGMVFLQYVLICVTLDVSVRAQRTDTAHI